MTEGTVGKYCGTVDPSLVMGNQVNDKMAVTHDVNLQSGDVIQFWVRFLKLFLTIDFCIRQMSMEML